MTCSTASWAPSATCGATSVAGMTPAAASAAGPRRGRTRGSTRAATLRSTGAAGRRRDRSARPTARAPGPGAAARRARRGARPRARPPRRRGVPRRAAGGWARRGDRARPGAAVPGRRRRPAPRSGGERALTTWILLDVSASMAFGTGPRLKSDVAEGVVEVVGRLAVRRAGRVALLTCGAPVTRLLPPRGGRRALVALRRAVAQGVAPDGTPPPADALAAALRRMGRVTRGAGLVVVVSDFREGAPHDPELAGHGPKPEWAR